jgi:flagellin
MAVINTNVKALFSQAALASTGRAQTVAMQQLSTGKRINSARDDAAGMAIATRMTHQIRSLNQAVRNAGDAVSMIQTAEGATNEITDMLLRMRELAIQAANDTNSNDQRSYLDLEFQQLKKQIVQISENTDWNGFPLLNGTAGEIVGPLPVYKATGNGLYDGTVKNEVVEGSAITSVGGSTVTDSGTGVLAKSGHLSITMTSATAGTATLRMEDGSTVPLEFTVEDSDPTAAVKKNIIRFKDTLLTDGDGTFELKSSANSFAANEVLSVDIGRGFTTIQPIKSNDVIINGVGIPLALAKNDTISPQDSGNAISSALSRAAAINEVYGLTGVRAVVQKTEMSGAAMSGDAILTGTSTGTVTINGYTSAKFTTVENNTRASREEVVKAINMISELTGVVAKDTGLDQKGIELTAADGRNIEIAFNTSDSTVADFSSRTGLKQGLQIGTYSLESKVETDVKITSAENGVIERAGLRVGDFTENVTRMSTLERPKVEPPVAQVSLVSYDDNPSGEVTVVVNGESFTTPAATASVMSGLLKTAINNKSDKLQVEASVDADGSLVLKSTVEGVPFTLSASIVDGDTATITTPVANTPRADRALKHGDLVINGVEIPGSIETGDVYSQEVANSSNRASSAIAIADAINAKSDVTGVKAVANSAVMSATSAVNTKLPASGYYSIFVNGHQVTVYLSQNETADERLNNIITAFKKQEGQHGVVASKNAVGGLKLETKDGRNLSVWFDSEQLDEVNNPQAITAQMFGLQSGTAVPQQTTLTFGGAIAVGDKVSFKINSTVVEVEATSTDPADLADAFQTAIERTNLGDLGIAVSVNADGELVLDSSTNAFSMGAANTDNSLTSVGIVTRAGEPLDVDGNPTSDPITPSASDVLGYPDADATWDGAKTQYGSVTLVSEKKFTIESGSNGQGASSNLHALGFIEGSYGGRSAADLSPPRVGRMNFQVGPSANQVISFDLADFGKSGPITQEITWDVDLDPMKPGETVPSPGTANPIHNGKPLTRSFITSKESALEVLNKLDVTMDRVNATRATMGAVMNRLDHVITNLTNVSMNLSASRSQIEDADYASASTELAKTQIMQQAATAVLAQANTSQQSVLKLLQGG